MLGQWIKILRYLSSLLYEKLVLSDLRDIQSNNDTEFEMWCAFVVDVVKTYYRHSTAILVMKDLITNFQDQMSDRNHTEIFSLLPPYYHSLILIFNKAQQNFANYSKPII